MFGDKKLKAELKKVKEELEALKKELALLKGKVAEKPEETLSYEKETVVDNVKEIKEEVSEKVVETNESDYQKSSPKVSTYDEQSELDIFEKAKAITDALKKETKPFIEKNYHQAKFIEETNNGTIAIIDHETCKLIKNSDKNAKITEFAYRNYGYNGGLIYIKNNDYSWARIYYKWVYGYDDSYDAEWYEDILDCTPELSDEEILCINSFISHDEEAVKLFNDYINHKGESYDRSYRYPMGRFD